MQCEVMSVVLQVRMIDRGLYVYVTLFVRRTHVSFALRGTLTVRDQYAVSTSLVRW